MVYSRYIHKCNLRTSYKGRQLCGIQKVYSQMQSENVILRKTTLSYTEGIFTNAIKEHNLREDNCGIQKVFSQMQS